MTTTSTDSRYEGSGSEVGVSGLSVWMRQHPIAAYFTFAFAGGVGVVTFALRAADASGGVTGSRWAIAGDSTAGFVTAGGGIAVTPRRSVRI